MALSTPKGKDRVYLSLKSKYEVVKAAGCGAVPIRKLAEVFGCSKSQIGVILKKRNEIVSQYEANMANSSVQLKKTSRRSKYGDINDCLYEWYLMATSKNTFPTGPLLTEKASRIALHLGQHDFRGSSGWLTKWKQRFNVKRVTICGEYGDARGETVESWKERLPQILDGYDRRDIWNMDETGCFWKTLPDKGFARKGVKCKGGKKSKQRMTLAFFVNAEGEKAMPAVIWKSEIPRCFKRNVKKNLPVRYYSQSKSWMTGSILDSVLSSLNRKLSSQRRSILLLLDNAGCHPHDLQGKYSNIKLLFLPPNTTSELQPLDLGIIQNFKVFYKSLFLRYVLERIEDCETVTDVVKSVNILMAIRWVSEEWKEVKPDTTKKCFRKAGILADDMAVAHIPDADPFEDVDENAAALQELIDAHSGGAENSCHAEEYVEGENYLPVCFIGSDDDWEEFMETLAAKSDPSSTEQESDDDDEIVCIAEVDPPLKISTFSEALTQLEDVKLFLESKNCAEKAKKSGQNIDRVAACSRRCTK